MVFYAKDLCVEHKIPRRGDLPARYRQRLRDRELTDIEPFRKTLNR